MVIALFCKENAGRVKTLAAGVPPAVEGSILRGPEESAGRMPNAFRILHNASVLYYLSLWDVSRRDFLRVAQGFNLGRWVGVDDKSRRDG